jgi:hypothetical protein
MYNIVIDGLIQRYSRARAPEDLDRANKLLETMTDKGPHPDIFTHNSFLKLYSEGGDIQSIAQRLRLLSSTKIQPDVVSFQIILKGLLQAGHPQAVQTTLDLMQAFGIERTAFVYGQLLSAIVTIDGVVYIDEAIKLLATMDANGAPPDERTYSFLLAGLFRQRSLPDDELLDRERTVRELMAGSKTNFSPISYSNIISACLEPASYPSPSMVDTGLRYYNEMIRRGAIPNSKAWQLVLGTLWTGRRDAHATATVLDTMNKVGFRADLRLHTLVKKIRRELGQAGGRGFGP